MPVSKPTPAPALRPRSRARPELLGVLLVVGLLALVPWALGPFERGLLLRMLIWGLFALSFDVVFGYAGLLSLGHSVYFGLGAYGAAWTLLALHSSASPGAGLGTGMALGVVLPLLAGLGLGGLIAIGLAPLLVRTGRHGFIIATAVTALIAFTLAQSRRDLTGGDDGLTLPPLPLALGGWRVGCADPGPAYGLVLLLVAMTVALYGAIVRGPVGLALRLVRENERRAEALGFDVLRVKALAFALGGAGAALAGALYALTSCHVSTRVFHWLVSADALIWTLFGGAGTLVGPLLGTAVFLALREGLSGLWPPGYPILVGLALLLTVRAFPEGLLGLVLGLARGAARWAWPGRTGRTAREARNGMSDGDGTGEKRAAGRGGAQGVRRAAGRRQRRF